MLIKYKKKHIVTYFKVSVFEGSYMDGFFQFPIHLYIL